MRALCNGTFKKVSSSVRSQPTTKPKSIPRRLLLLVVFALPPCMVDPRYTSAYPAGTSSLIASLNVFKTSGRLNIRVLTAFRSRWSLAFLFLCFVLAPSKTSDYLTNIAHTTRSSVIDVMGSRKSLSLREGVIQSNAVLKLWIAIAAEAV